METEVCKQMNAIISLFLFSLPILSSAFNGIPAHSVPIHSLHPCAKCCAQGPSNPACDFSFDGGSGVCCGAIAAQVFCCPSEVNSTCATEGNDATYQCRSRSHGASFPTLIFSTTAFLLVLGAACFAANLFDGPLAAAIRKAEYQQLCGHPHGYPSPFGAETSMRVFNRPDADEVSDTEYQ